MSAIDELIKNAKTANEGLRPHYKWKNNGTGINLAFNMTSQEVTNAAERDLAALRAERDEAERLLEFLRAAVKGQDIPFDTETCAVLKKHIERSSK